MKKIIKLSITALISFTIISTLSCADKISYTNKTSYKSTDYNTKKFKPLDYNIFNDLGKEEPVFHGGINFTAYSQGMSFIFNILKGLGWNWEDSEKIKKIYDEKFDFDDINILKNSESGFIKESNLISSRYYDLGKQLENKFKNKFTQFIIDKSEKNLVSKLYNQIKSLIYINTNLEDNELLKVDASTKVEIELPSNFKKSNEKEQLKIIASKLNKIEVVKKIFDDKKYAYSWNGNVLDKLGFQIQENKIVFWHISDELPNIIDKIEEIRKLNKKLEENIDNELKEKEQKNLNQVILDPFGSKGTMPSSFFYTNLNLKKTDSRKNTFNEYFKNLKVSIEKDGELNLDGNKINIACYNSFIDGGNPGSVILKMFSGEEASITKLFNKIKYPLKTFNTKNRIQTFYKLKNTNKIKQIVKLINKFIKFLKEEIHNKDRINTLKLIKGIGSPVIKSFFEFIKNNNITEKDIQKSFNNNNNGSHYMLAVEIFLRGMKNIPKKFTSNYKFPAATNMIMLKKKYDRNIIGMANVNNFVAIMFMIYTSNKKSLPKNPNFNNNNKNISKRDIFHFNPQTLKFDISYTLGNYHIEDYFIKDLSEFKKTGNEIKPYDL